MRFRRENRRFRFSFRRARARGEEIWGVRSVAAEDRQSAAGSRSASASMGGADTETAHRFPRASHERYGRAMTVTPEPAPVPRFSPPPPRPKRRTGRIILIVVAALVALVVVLVIGAFLLVSESTKDAQKVSDQLITAVQAGDGAKAYALTGPSFRAATTEAELTELISGLSTLVTKDKRSPDGKAISASTESGKIAVFTYTMKGTNGKPVYFKTQIRKEDGRWQVMSFRSSEKKLTTDIE